MEASFRTICATSALSACQGAVSTASVRISYFADSLADQTVTVKSTVEPHVVVKGSVRTV